MNDGAGPHSLTTNNLEAWWMPFTANRQFKKAPRMLVAARGCTTVPPTAARSSTARRACGASTPGMAGQEIADAVARQIRELDYAPPFQMGHPLAFELASKRREDRAGAAWTTCSSPIPAPSRWTPR